MSNLKRYYIPNSTIFITSVTRDRRKIFLDPKNIQIFWDVIKATKEENSFEIPAYVLLPDHFHLLLSLGEEGSNFSKILQLIKGRFTNSFKKLNKIESPVSLWQKRFWDHVIRNEEDYKLHIDYIHWNPVKHGLTNDPMTWQYSSFSTWCTEGIYPEGWGNEVIPVNVGNLDFE